MMWAVLAFISSFFRAGCFLVNERFKVPGLKLVFWCDMFIVLFLLPVVPFLAWPQQPVFYLMTAVTALLVILGNTLTQNTIAKFGAGVTSRLLPISLLVTFLAWLVASPDMLQTYLAQPLRFMGIILSFSGCIYFLSSLRHCPITRQASALLLPAILCMGLVAVCNKVALDAAETPGRVYTYMFLQAAIIVLIILIGAAFRLRKPLKTILIENGNRHLILAGFLLGSMLFVSLVTINQSYILSSNPAFSNAIAFSAPLWIIGFYRLIGKKEEVDVRAGLMAVLCVIILTILAV